MQHIIRPFWVTALVLAMAGSVCLSAAAAPFCVTNQAVPPQCIYFDAHQCQQEAQKQGGQCSANSTELSLNRGVGQYCVVTSGGAANCNYADFQTCTLDAQRANAACTPATGRQPVGAPDPYSSTDGN